MLATYGCSTHKLRSSLSDLEQCMKGCSRPQRSHQWDKRGAFRRRLPHGPHFVVVSHRWAPFIAQTCLPPRFTTSRKGVPWSQHARAKFTWGSCFKVAKAEGARPDGKPAPPDLLSCHSESRPRRRSFAASLSSIHEAKVSQTLRRSYPRVPIPNTGRCGLLQLPSCVIFETSSRTTRANTTTGVDTWARRPRRRRVVSVVDDRWILFTERQRAKT
jgi:hypothetical protein